MSSCGITDLSADCLLEYLTSSRSRSLLSCTFNANHFRLDLLETLAAALEGANFSLERIEFFAAVFGYAEGETGGTADPMDDDTYNACLINFRRVGNRNAWLSKKVQASSLRLLSATRTLLNSTPSSTSNSPPSPFCWGELPPEVKLAVLKHVDDERVVSPKQLARITNYATMRPETHLPSTNRSIHTLQSRRPATRWEMAHGWLISMECTCFEPYEGWERDHDLDEAIRQLA
jgi:hypothetical protein